jgi:hypothetical protein
MSSVIYEQRTGLFGLEIQAEVDRIWTTVPSNFGWIGVKSFRCPQNRKPVKEKLYETERRTKQFWQSYQAGQ